MRLSAFSRISKLHIQISNIHICVVPGPASQDAVYKRVCTLPGLQCWIILFLSLQSSLISHPKNISHLLPLFLSDLQGPFLFLSYLILAPFNQPAGSFFPQNVPFFQADPSWPLQQVAMAAFLLSSFHSNHTLYSPLAPTEPTFFSTSPLPCHPQRQHSQNRFCHLLWLQY